MSGGCSRIPSTPTQLAELHIRCESIRLMAWKGLTDVERYGQPGPEGSLVKWLWSDTNQRLTELAVDIVGPEALTAGTSWSYEFLRARGNTIEGGTTEVLKNIVAERVLGPAAAEGGRIAMDFGFTDDQREIQRTARELLSERARPERVREHAEAGRMDTELWTRAVRARLARDRHRRGARRPGPRGGSSCRSSVRSSAARWRLCRSCRARWPRP